MVQGSMPDRVLWQASSSVRLPRAIDTGVDVLTRGNSDPYLADAT
jgi:hypothetical protein